MFFTTTSRRRGYLAGAVAASLLALTPSAAHAGAAPLIWAFDKCAVGAGVWQGTAEGQGSTESLTTRLTSIRTSGTILHVTFDWQVGSMFLAPLEGTLNQSTGVVVMNGVVADGAYTGSQVHEEGHLYDPDRSCFTGTIQLMPASS